MYICKYPFIHIIYLINMMVCMIYRYVIYYYHIIYDGLNVPWEFILKWHSHFKEVSGNIQSSTLGEV